METIGMENLLTTSILRENDEEEFWLKGGGNT